MLYGVDHSYQVSLSVFFLSPSEPVLAFHARSGLTLEEMLLSEGSL